MALVRVSATRNPSRRAPHWYNVMNSFLVGASCGPVRCLGRYLASYAIPYTPADGQIICIVIPDLSRVSGTLVGFPWIARSQTALPAAIPYYYTQSAANTQHFILISFKFFIKTQTSNFNSSWQSTTRWGSQ